MKISVNVNHSGKNFTYDSKNFKVNVGDTVLLPYPAWYPDQSGDGVEGVVVETNVSYSGYLRPILGVVKYAKQKTPVLAPTAVLATAVESNNTVSVKEIEALIRDANFLVVDQIAFERDMNGRWHQLN
jgi:hypothetical protein